MCSGKKRLEKGETCKPLSCCSLSWGGLSVHPPWAASAHFPGVLGEGRDPRGCLDEEMRMCRSAVTHWSHILESLIHLLGHSPGDNSSWGETVPQQHPARFLQPRAGMGNGHNPQGFYLPLFVSACVEVEDLYLPCGWVWSWGQVGMVRTKGAWCFCLLFSLKVLLTVLLDAGKGSVAISSYPTNSNFALQQHEMIWSALSRFISLHLLVFHCTSVRVRESQIKSGIRLTVSYSHFSWHCGSCWISGYQVSLTE